jgi:ligand-binding sensor domain-containing protein
MRVIALLLVWAAFVAPGVLAPHVHAQDGRWETHTSFRQSADGVFVDGAIWVATSGGVYRYVADTGERNRFTVVEGLYGIDARALDYDASRGMMWIGYSDGVLDRMNVETGSVRTFFDIRRAERFPSRGIVDLQVAGDSLFVLTEFGIVVFDTRSDRLEVRDTYAQLGLNATVGVRVNDVARTTWNGEDVLFAGGVEGLSMAPSASPNLQDPSAWTRVTHGPFGEAVLSLASHNGALFIGAAAGLFRLDQDGAISQVHQAQNVRSVHSADGRLLASDGAGVIEVMSDGAIRRTQVAGFSQHAGILPAGNTLWVLDAQRGVGGLPLASLSGGSIEASIADVMPGGPFSGSFSTIQIDATGALWATGVEGAGTGVHRLDPDGSWLSLVGATNNVMASRNSFLALDTDDDGNAWAGSHGFGMVRISPSGDVEVYDHTNTALTPIAGSTNFTVVRGVGIDPSGNVWASNVFGQTQLVVRRPEGEWEGVQPSCPGFPTSGNVLMNMFVDSFGNKWFIVVAEGNLRLTTGVMVYDAGQISDRSNDACRFFRTEGGAGQGLPSVLVNGVAEDRDGRVWLATATGPAYAPNSRLLPQSTGEVFIWPQLADRSLGNFLLFGVPTTTVAVDAANRIWFGTATQGVFAVQDSPQGGFEVVAHFTPQNSPLLSESIVDIAADSRSGRIYFATNRGLISYDAGAVAPVETAGALRIFPNPVYVSDGVAPRIRIDGLVEATELRIVTAGGEVVRRMTTRGGQVEWDGRDEDGRLVSSGMYLVIAVGTGGEGRGVGKVAVIR